MAFDSNVTNVPPMQPPTFSSLLTTVQTGLYTHVVWPERMTRDQVVRLTTALMDNTSIVGLRLPYCFLTSKNLEVLLESIANNKSMQWLQISCDTGFDATGWHAFEKYLDKNEILRILHLRWSSSSQSFVEALSKGLAANKGIGELSLAGSKLGPRWTHIFAGVLSQNITLHTLVLSRCKLGNECIVQICNAMSKKGNIQELDLSANEITSSGAASLAELLVENENRITKLNMRYNRIEDEGAFSIARVLRSTERLTSLDLTNNHINDPGIYRLADVLSGKNGNLKLRTLECKQSTQVKKEHMDSIAASLRRNRRLWREALDATLEDDEEAAWNCGKLMVVGQAEAGKTATVRALLTEEFDHENSHTLGIKMHKVKSIKGNVWEKDKAKTFVETFIDKLKLERIANKLFTQRVQARRNQSGYKPTDLREKREKLKKEQAHKNKRKSIMSPIIGALGLSKEEGNGDEEKEEEAQDEEKQEHPEDVEEMDEDDINQEERSLKISMWDYSGQKVFHTLHHLFLSKNGVYLVVFNMAAFHGVEQRRRTLSYLRFWLNTINLHAADAPVLIVGTHSKDVDDTRRNKIAQAIGKITASMHNIVRDPQNFIYFPVENTEGVGIVDLRRAVAKTFREQEFINRKIPLCWVKGLDALINAGQKGGEEKHFLQYANAEKVMMGEGVAKEDVPKTLEFMHDLGLVYYFSKTAFLRDKVVLKPEWLVDEVCRVVRDKKVHREEFESKLNEEELRKLDLDGDLETLFGEALVSKPLLGYFWGGYDDFMRDLMKTHLLMCDWTWTDPPKFFVPAMAKSLRKARKDKEKRTVEFDAFPPKPSAVFQFEYLPEGVFQRLECECVRQSIIDNEGVNLPEPIVYKDAMKFNFNDKCVVYLALDVVKLTHVDTPKRIWVFVASAKEGSEATDDQQRVKDMIKEILEKLKQELFGEAFLPRELANEEVEEILVEDNEQVKRHALEKEKELAAEDAI